MKTITIAAEKGGVGKSAIAVHLAFYLHELGRKVLFIDLDPQGNASHTLAREAADRSTRSPRDAGVTTRSLFVDEAFELATADSAFAVIRADRRLIELDRAEHAAVILPFRNHLARLAPTFDVCVIDTPPTFGIKLLAPLFVSDFAVSPITVAADGYSLRGVEDLLRNVLGIKQRFNPNLKFLGMLLNRFDPVEAGQKDNLQQLLGSRYMSYLLPARINKRGAIPASLHAGEPVWKLRKTAAREAGVEMRKAMGVIVDAMDDAEALPVRAIA